jgi:hypothetical protein
LGRCARLLQVCFIFILEKNPQGEKFMFKPNFFPVRWKQFGHSL